MSLWEAAACRMSKHIGQLLRTLFLSTFIIERTFHDGRIVVDW